MLRPLIYFCLLIFCLPGRAAAPLSVPSNLCRTNPLDKFEPARVFTRGSFAKQCLDASSVRPVQILSESAEQITVSNFYDQDHFWRLEIPKSAVAQVLFHIVPFESGVPLIQAAHTQLRFRLSRAAKMKSQADGREGVTQDLIISSTFVAPAGEEYSALKSLSGSYGIVTRLLSARARGREEIEKDKSVVRQFVLDLSAEERNALLLAALHRSATDDYAQEYRLLKNNCSTIVFEILDQVRPRPPGVAPVVGTWWNMRDEFIGPSIEALRARKLIHADSEIAPMNAEMKF